jgi:hypothetical protein
LTAWQFPVYRCSIGRAANGADAPKFGENAADCTLEGYPSEYVFYTIVSAAARM